LITSELRMFRGSPAEACLAWRLGTRMLAASTAPVGGGIGVRRWVINAQVPSGYGRHDLRAHISEVATELGLEGPGVGMLTAAEVARATAFGEGDVRVEATVGLTWPIWAAAPDGERANLDGHRPGTVNLVTILPVRHTDAALANLLCTMTEAKVQALLNGGVAGTGTASDAVTVVCPVAGPAEPFGGPRSAYGAPVARCVYEAVRSGMERQ
jgi:adenosylcobinamide amidohydrolase